MKPPECCICDKRIKDFKVGGLINFQKTEADLQWERKMEEDGIVEHPPYAEWFCEQHFTLAKQYASLPCHEAMKEIKQMLNK